MSRHLFDRILRRFSANPFLPFVQEAIGALGYIKPEYDRTLADLLKAMPDQGPRAVDLYFRKNGDQLSDEEKKSLGLRRNAFFSREALESLTPKGIANIKEAHFVTLLRVQMSYYLARTIRNAAEMHIHRFEIVGVSDCCACKDIQSAVIGANEAASLPPANCPREVCGISLFPHVSID